MNNTNAALLLDTHIVLWLDTGHEKLAAKTRALIDDCWQAGGTIYLAATSAWEIALLADTGRIVLDLPADQWVARFLDRPGIEPASLSPEMAARTYAFQDFDHRDPADRQLVANAIALACPLVTYDERLTQFAKRRGKKYGFTVLR